MGEKKTNALSKSMKLIYVYAMATGAIFTFMCYWDGIFMSYTGPGTFLAFALMTLAVLPTAFVYAEFSTMLPSTGSCLVFNTVGINKHAGFWSAWLIMCAWIAVPAAGVLGIIEWLNHQFGLGLTGGKAVIVGSLVLCFWCVLSLYKNVVAGKVQSFMLMAGIAGILICSLLFLFSGHWSIANFADFFTSSNEKQWGGNFATGIAWVVGCSFMITPYFGFETVPAMVEEGDFPIKNQKKAILGSVITCGAIYTIFYFCLAGAMPWAELTNGGDCHPFITFEALQYCFGDKIAWFVLIMGIVGVVFPIGTSVLGFWYSGVRMIYAMAHIIILLLRVKRMHLATTSMMSQVLYVRTVISSQLTECFLRLIWVIILLSMIQEHMVFLWDTSIMES